MKVADVLRGIGGRRRIGRETAIPEGCLLTDPRQRDRWQAWFAEAVEVEGAEQVLTRHPRADALKVGVSAGAYLSANADVAAATGNTAEALFHYLEFGIPEGRSALADEFDPRIVTDIHGHELDSTLSPPDAARALVRLGVPHADIVLCERDLWLSLGLWGPALTSAFHHEFYFAQLEAGGHELPSPDRMSCLRHYLATGLDAGLPAHPDHVIDPDFYRASLKGRGLPAPAKDADLARHWAGEGLRRGHHANAQTWMMAHHGLRLPKTVVRAISVRSTQDLERVISDPISAIRSLDLIDPGNRQFVIDLARTQRHRGEKTQAEALLETVLTADPDNARAALDLADLIHGTGQVEREILLRRIPPASFDSGANRVTLAELHLASRRIVMALDLIDRLPRAAQADIALMRRARAVAKGAFDALWRDLPRHAERLGIAKLQELLTQAIQLYAPPPDLIRRSGQIKRVAILANDDLYQCKLYRADQKVEQLRTQGIAARVYLQSRDVAALHADLEQFHAVIFQRNPAFPAIADVMVEAANRGLATFYDIDDLVFDPSHFPPPLSTYGGQITADQHTAIACGVPLFAAAARLCAVGIASTEPIRAALAPLTRTGTAIVHRNAIGAAHLTVRPPAKKAAGDKLVVFYGSGTKAHKQDFRDILEPALAKVLAERPGQVEVRLMGEFPDFTTLDPDHPDVHMRAPIWDFETYLGALAQADIAVSVLSPSPSADAKSEIKWLEPALFGIPTVASPTQGITDAVTDGETALLASNVEEFTAAVLRLVDDGALRQRIGSAAQNAVQSAYAPEVMGGQLATHLSNARATRAPRLLVVNVFYPPQDIGGATRVVADNVRHLLDHHRFEIDVLTTLDGGPVAHDITPTGHSGARVWSITAADSVDEAAISDPVMDARIEALFDRIKPEIVHIHCVQRLGAGVVDICRRRGIPYVVTLHDGWWSSPHQFIVGPDGEPHLYDFHEGAERTPRAEIAMRCLIDADALLAVSESFAALHRAAGLPHIQSLANGVSELPELARQPGTPGRVRLGMIGGASRHKGYDLLRAALTSRSYQNLDLLVVDHGLPMGAEVHEVWNTTPVLRIPRRPQSDVAGLYGTFDVLMAPSVWPESYGLVAREALALGLWVIASDRGAVGEDVREGVTGHIVPVEDHRALAEILSRIDADPDTYGAPTGQVTDLRNAGQQGDELATLYHTILARRGRG